MVEAQKSSGTRRSEILQAEMRDAADARNVAGICIAYVNTALQILAEFPNMSAKEKQVHYDCLKDDIERLKVRTNQDCSNVLGELKKILS